MICRCGHEREWHDSCSKCYCPYFLDPDAPAALVRKWDRARAARKKAER